MIGVHEIAEMLRPHADAIARQMLPAGHYEMNRLEWACSGSQSPTGEAISVHVGGGAKQGVCGFWNGAKRGGDLIDLIEQCMGGGKHHAVNYAKEYLGLGAETVVPMSLEMLAERERKQKARERADVRDREERASAALRVWQGASPLQGVGLDYLRSRGIDPKYAEDGCDAQLCFYHGLAHPAGGVFPAIIARVCDVDNKLVGVWRIFLKPDGSGKAPVETPRLGLGNVKGGAVRIGGVWPEIGIAEGLENALAARQLVHMTTGKMIPVWPTLSTSGMRGVILPPEIGKIRIYADHDTIKFRKSDGAVLRSPGLSAAAELAARLMAEGRDVVVEKPPAGLDWTQVINMTDRVAA